MNTEKLEEKMVKSGYAIKDVAKLIDINEKSIEKKMKGVEEFTVKETIKLTTILNLTRSEVQEIFFDI